MGPLAPLLIGAGAGILGNLFSASQANRFSERMSSTAHQREVVDLRRAGLNPMLSANRGASAPQGALSNVTEGASRGVSTALQIQQAKANIDVLHAQAENLRATTRSSTAGAMRTEAMTPGELALQQSHVKIADMDVAQRKALFSTVVKRAKEELRLTVASADRARIGADLDAMLRAGSLNVQAFEKKVGELGPAMKWLMDIARIYNLATGDPIRRIP